MRPSRILYLHNSEKIGGGNKVLLGLFERIDRSRFEPWSLIPAPGPMESELKARGVRYLIRDIIGPSTSGNSVSQARALAWFFLRVRTLRFSIVHAQGPLSYRLPSFVSPLCSFRTVCHLHFPAAESGKIAWALRTKPDLMIACSNHVAETYQNKLLAENIDVPMAVIHNFVDASLFCPGPHSMALAQELKISDDVAVVAIIGLVSERKGHPHFIHMARKLLQRNSKIKFLIVGEDILTNGDYRGQMEQLATNLHLKDYVSFLGFRSDVLEIIRLCDVVVLPSHAEGMPMTILEVGACAKPVVAYAIPGVTEVLENGVNGLVVPENDVDALAEAVERILSSSGECLHLGRNARKRIEDRYTLDTYVTEVEKAYDFLLHS